MSSKLIKTISIIFLLLCKTQELLIFSILKFQDQLQLHFQNLFYTCDKIRIC